MPSIALYLISLTPHTFARLSIIFHHSSPPIPPTSTSTSISTSNSTSRWIWVTETTNTKRKSLRIHSTKRAPALSEPVLNPLARGELEDSLPPDLLKTATPTLPYQNLPITPTQAPATNFSTTEAKAKVDMNLSVRASQHLLWLLLPPLRHATSQLSLVWIPPSPTLLKLA